MTTINPYYFDPTDGKFHPHEPIYTATANKVVNTQSTDTSIIGTGDGTMVIPLDFFATRRTIRLSASGTYTIAAGDNPNDFIMKVWKNGIGGDLIASGSQNGIVTAADLLWTFELELTGRSSTTIIGQGWFLFDDAAAAHPISHLPIGTGKVPVAISNLAQPIDVSMQIKNNAAGNSNVTSTNFTMTTVN